MNDLISKSKVLKWLEIQIADCSRELKRELFADDLVIVSERLDTFKKVYDNIKQTTPLQFTDSADRAENYTKREIETAVKNNCLTIRLNLAYAEIESLKRKYNEALKAQSKQEWISCDDRLPETDDYYLVYGVEYDFPSGEEIPYCGILQYSLKYKAWNTKAPVIITHWQSLTEPPKAEKAKEFSEEEIANWINCKYELPEHLKNVLVCTKRGLVIEAYYDEESKEWTITNSESRITNITHWQPLPEPPKGE